MALAEYERMLLLRLMNRHLRLILLAFTMLGAPIVGRADPIDTFFPTIANLPLIRVGLTEALNNGHQSLAATIVTRLRQLGYKGTLEIVYENDYDGEMPRRLKNLFPQFLISDKPVQSYPGLRFVTENYFSKFPTQFPPVPLAIMGGDDSHKRPANYRAQVLLTVQPWTWPVPPQMQFDRTTAPSANLEIEQLRGFIPVFKPPKLSELEELIRHDTMNQPSMSSKVIGLQALAKRMNRIDMATVYGHHVGRGQALVFAAGLQMAVSMQPRLFPKGIVLPVFNNFPDDRWDYFEYQKRLPQFSGLSFAEIADLDLPDKIDKLAPGKILLVRVGLVPKRIFEVFSANSSIPPLMEGRNSMGFMSMLGRPYLPSHDIELFQYEHDEEFSDVQNGMDGAAIPLTDFSLDSILVNAEVPTALEKLAWFFIETRFPRSRLNQFFAKQKVSSNEYEKDRIFQLLKMTEQTLALNHAPFADCTRFLAPAQEKVKTF